MKAYSYADAILKLSFEKLNPAVFFNFQYRMIQSIIIIDCVTESLCKSFVGVQVMGKINLQCNDHSQTHSSVFFRLKTVRQVEHTWGKC